MRAPLGALVDDETEIKFPILLRDLEDRLVVVQTIDVHLARHLEEELQVVDEVPAEVSQRGRFLIRISSLFIFPAGLEDWLLKLEAPVFLVLHVFAKEALILASIRSNFGTSSSSKAILISTDKLLASIN